MFHVEHYFISDSATISKNKIYIYKNAAYIYNKKIYYMYNVSRGTLSNFRFSNNQLKNIYLQKRSVHIK